MTGWGVTCTNANAPPPATYLRPLIPIKGHLSLTPCLVAATAGPLTCLPSAAARVRGALADQVRRGDESWAAPAPCPMHACVTSMAVGCRPFFDVVDLQVPSCWSCGSAVDASDVVRLHLPQPCCKSCPHQLNHGTKAPHIILRPDW